MTQRALLKLYLNRYNRAKNRRSELENTYSVIEEDSKVPYKESYKKTTRVQSSNGSSGTIEIVIKLDEIRKRIDDQSMLMSKLIIEIFNILDFLPTESEGRSLLELRYIQHKSEKAICSSLYIGRSKYYDLLNATLDTLIAFPKVSEILKEYEKELESDAAKPSCQEFKSKS